MIHYPGTGLVAASSSPSKSTSGVLSDLGKPTLRGIRKCPKCGTYNGTRGLSCKNKSCDMVFKEAEGRNKRAGCDAVRLYTGTTTSIFSVRLRDKGPDYRGFVQLPTVEGLTLGESLEGEAAMLVQSASQCYVESCVRSGGGGDGTHFSCPHIAACLAPGVGEATPVMLRHSAMNDLNIRSEIKHEVYSRAEQIAGPLVQRVSKHVFCVKCEDDQRHPLGYLHMCFMDQRTKDGPGVEHRFFCTCSTFRGLDVTSSPLFPQWTAMDREREPDWVLRRCVHFYSCLCAFASDAKLSEEFKLYIVMDQEIANRAAEQSSLQENQVIAILGQDENGDTVQVEVLNQAELRGVLGQHSEGILSDHKDMEGLVTITEDIQIEMETPDGHVQSITVPAASLAEAGTISSLNNTKVQGAGGTRRRQHSGRGVNMASPVKRNCGGSVSVASRLAANQDSVEENNVALTFHEWLGSVTERINQTMHYQFDGHPEPLVFHAPQVFFDCLRERISMGSRKKRLPNSTTAFVRKDALPLGTFTKYTWSIHNVLQVKQIFDTPHLPLEVTRTFVENKDGSFSVHTAPDTEGDQFLRLPGKRIKAHELKTFLKVGQTLADQKELTPFVIEWIPDILPFMKIGELRIKFEYGHQRNGQLEQRITVPVHISDGMYNV